MNKTQEAFINPYRPGAGHMPPHLAGREEERAEFRRLLRQETILQNLLLSGLRGVGKTVLLDALKPMALEDGWHWIGGNISESASISETNIATRLLTDLSVVTTSIVIEEDRKPQIGFAGVSYVMGQRLDYDFLTGLFNTTPGLASDKLKAVLELVWIFLRQQPAKGLVVAYDEAQNLDDHSVEGEYPLSLLLDVFQSIQKGGIPFMLALAGLPTLFPRLVEARTFAERMFRVVTLDRLTDDESREAILEPIVKSKSPLKFTDEWVDVIIEISAGYPYFIQFACREIYDVLLQQFSRGEPPSVPIDAILAKLDADFFAGRWGRATDRQQELLRVIATLGNCDSEFTLQQIVERSRETLQKPFSASHVSQLLASLSGMGLVFKNRRGKYSFAVPLMGRFINRQRG